MTKRLILYLSMMFLLSGCTIKYNLEIKDNQIYEKIIIPYNLDDEKYVYDELKNEYSNYSNKKKYKVSKISEDGSNSYLLSSNYLLSKNVYLRSFSECFDAYNLVYVDDKKDSYILQTSKGFKCMGYEFYPIDSFEINININHKVIDHNADKVDGSTYTWYIDKTNSSNKYISIMFEKNYDSEITGISATKNKKNDLKTILIVVGMFLIIGIFLVLHMLSLNNRKNRL